jgi:hypothetical protein
VWLNVAIFSASIGVVDVDHLRSAPPADVVNRIDLLDDASCAVTDRANMSLSYLALAASILIGVRGQVCLKLGAANAGGVAEQFLRWQTISGLLLYLVSGIVYVVAMRRSPVSIGLSERLPQLRPDGRHRLFLVQGSLGIVTARGHRPDHRRCDLAQSLAAPPRIDVEASYDGNL